MTILILAALVLVVGGVLWSGQRGLLAELTRLNVGLDALARHASYRPTEDTGPCCAPCDAGPLYAEVEKLGALLRNQPAPPVVDLSPLVARVAAVEDHAAATAKHAAAKAERVQAAMQAIAATRGSGRAALIARLAARRAQASAEKKALGKK
jgi:hypothetical protein